MCPTPTGSTAARYAEAVLERARVPMEPIGFEPDWDDQPSRHKTYPDAPLLALPHSLPDGAAPAGRVLARQPANGAPDRSVSVADVAALLSAYGLSQRRLRLNWNEDNYAKMSYARAVWARPTASGGGMYPLETYWAAGPSGSLLPGVYHYATGRHALERLAVGDVTARVRRALGDHPAAASSDQFLLVTVRFWKNAFKYTSFCYHVVTQDLGALLGSWTLLATALGIDLEHALWFDDTALDELLGLDPMQESVLAVVPLPSRAATVIEEGPERVAGPQSAVTMTPWERSQRVLRFEQVEEVHRATLVADEPRPPADRAADAAAGVPEDRDLVALPDSAPADIDFAEALRRRRTSFGSFTAAPPLSLAELGGLLAPGASAAGLRCDLKPGADPPAWTRLHVLANHVEDLEAGTYAYHAGRHGLAGAQALEVGRFLQERYFLSNYNMDQVAAVIAISGRVDAMIRAYGDRGYRMLNAEVGAVAQTVYCAASALSLGCGAVLGFDNIALDEALGLAGSDERSLLFVLVGHERPGLADFETPMT